MATARHIRIFVSSPSDVAEERRQLKAVVEELSQWFSDQAISLELIMWETHSYPSLEAPQVAINRQIGSYDVFVGIMWKRFGTPSPTAGSGTEDEFRIAYKLWEGDKRRPVLFYFSEKPYNLGNRDDIEQLGRVLGFKQELTKKAFVCSYATADHPDFEAAVRPQLRKAIQDYVAALETDERSTSEEKADAPAVTVAPSRVPSTLFAVHIADYCGQPEYLREEIIEKLCQGGATMSIPVIETAELTQRDPSKPTVSIHLFDGCSGPSDHDLLELGSKHAAWQVIWAPKGLDITRPLNGRTSLQQLATATDDAPRYQFTRIAARDAAEDIVARVAKLEQQWRFSHARCVLLDVNRKDSVKVKELIEYLDEHGVERATIRPYEDPGLVNFDDALVRSKVLMFVSGQVGQQYVQGRLLSAANRLGALGRKVHKVGVYGAPPQRQPRDSWRFEPPIPIAIKFIDNTMGFDPAELKDLLAEIMEADRHEAAV